jgi:hypothetical protein
MSDKEKLQLLKVQLNAARKLDSGQYLTNCDVIEETAEDLAMMTPTP